MRIRYVALLFAIGIFLAWLHSSASEAMITIFGCLSLHLLRRIEHRIGDMRCEMEALRDRHFLVETISGEIWAALPRRSKCVGQIFADEIRLSPAIRESETE
jgi:hypothetical protein